MRAGPSLITAACFAVLAAAAASADPPRVASRLPERDPGWQAAAANDSAPLRARIVDVPADAARRAVTVQVRVEGVRLAEPGSPGPPAGRGHLHYRLDDGPVIVTTAVRLSFQQLTLGEHALVVTLSGDDHQPLGPRQTLKFTIQ